jgi:signal transduction histidine kinase
MTTNRGWRAYAPDVALAVGIPALPLVNGLARGTADLGPLDALVLLVCALALAACRRAPVPALLVVTACMLAFTARLHPGNSAAVPVLGAVYLAHRAGHRIIASAASAVFLFGSLALDLSAPAPGLEQTELADRTGLMLGWFVAAGVAAAVSNHRRAYLQQVEERAREAERTREETARRRAGEERLRIARELHDSLTHSISIIKVQAGVAVHLANKRGEEPPAALLAIQEASTDAMRELRATLEVLRDPDPEAAAPGDAAMGDAGPGDAGHRIADRAEGGTNGATAGQAPGQAAAQVNGRASGQVNGAANGSGLDRLNDLVERARAAGLPATVTVSGDRRALPAEVDRTAYRIVQEALTNITRHAGEATASVRIDYRPDELVVQVDDDGSATPAAAPVPGVGLTGMRERVTALGGRLRAEPRPEGGFRVRAELPMKVPA